MTRFPTPGHLASWARQAPGVSESAGRRKAKGAGRGNPYSGGTLGEAAASAARTQTFLGAKYRRLIRHMPKPKAQRAIMRTQLASRRRKPPSAASACPLKERFSEQGPMPLRGSVPDADAEL